MATELAAHAKLADTGWSLRNWRISRNKRKLAPPAGIDSPLIFQDGFGTRWTALDAESGEPVDILSFNPEFIEAPGFAGAVGERVARLARVKHASYARTRRIDRPTEDSLLLYSDRVPGWRLSEVLAAVEKEKLPVDIGAVLGLLRQLVPGVALFSRHQRDAAIGTVGPERLILTPQGRLVVAEYALAPGLEALQYSRERLWRDLRVTLPTSAGPSRIPPSADVIGMGVVTLSLLHGRLLSDDEFLFSLGDVVNGALETVGSEKRPLSAGLSGWLSRALQFDEASAFQSPQEAQVAFEEMLAKERGYVTTPAQLDLFVSRVERAIGPPPAVPAPAPLPIASGPTVVSLPQPAPPAVVVETPVAAAPPPSTPPAAVAIAPAQAAKPAVAKPAAAATSPAALPAAPVVARPMTADPAAIRIGGVRQALRRGGVRNEILIDPDDRVATPDGQVLGLKAEALYRDRVRLRCRPFAGRDANDAHDRRGRDCQDRGPQGERVCVACRRLACSRCAEARHREPPVSWTNAAASRSAHQITDPVARRTPAAGYLIQSPAPSSTCRSALALVAPATSTWTAAALVSAGNVSVRRSRGSTGACAATTHRVCSTSASDPGNSDAVWPSSPIPSRTTSKRGASPAKRFRSVRS
jgi:hypothetical protein